MNILPSASKHEPRWSTTRYLEIPSNPLASIASASRISELLGVQFTTGVEPRVCFRRVAWQASRLGETRTNATRLLLAMVDTTHKT